VRSRQLIGNPLGRYLGLLQSPCWWGVQPVAPDRFLRWGTPSQPLLLEPLIEPAGADALEFSQIADFGPTTQPTHQIIECR
jgi:hypothetical protein